ncbi:MAG TPA: circularly permuted type 2 ATP-grasp protein [Solirubrobacterales bacterium]|nr:circularly permuted type 2 ATP-grasp protein [Solirubrobacterales bacterium]
MDEYPLAADCYDEAFDSTRAPRAHYGPVIEALRQRDLEELRERVQADCDARGVSFGDGGPLKIDPVPRVLGGEEWRSLEAGILQRARALNAFVVDVYGEQRIFEDGALPRHLLDSLSGYEPRMRGLIDPAVPPAAVVGLDLVRDASGEMLVLEDNDRMPSGAAYAFALREVVPEALGADVELLSIGDYAAALGAALRAAAPDGDCGVDPAIGGSTPQSVKPEGANCRIAVLSSGEESSAWFEHRRLAETLGVPAVTPAELATEGGVLYMRREGGRQPIDVLYRRLDEERLSDDDGRPTEIGELLLPALESGRLRCLNAFGTGVADDKLAHAYVERMIRFYFDEEPLLRSAPSYDLCDEGARDEALGRLDELTLKPRGGFGGKGVTVMPTASAEQRREARDLVRRHPERFVAQETISLSTHPTVCEGRLEPRRVDLRPFSVSGAEGAAAMPGGLTRFAAGAGDTIVNSSRGGGCKDTWVTAT